MSLYRVCRGVVVALCVAAPLMVASVEAQACKHAMREDVDRVAEAPRFDVAAQLEQAKQYAAQDAPALALRTLARVYPELTKLDDSYKKPSKINAGKRINHSAEAYSAAALLAAQVIAADSGLHALSAQGQTLDSKKQRQRQLDWSIKVLKHASAAQPGDVGIKQSLAQAMLAHPKHKAAGEVLSEQLKSAESADSAKRSASPAIGTRS
jgi:roadblock/LC7 domain-containing protein